MNRHLRMGQGQLGGNRLDLLDTSLHDAMAPTLLHRWYFQLDANIRERGSDCVTSQSESIVGHQDLHFWLVLQPALVKSIQYLLSGLSLLLVDVVLSCYMDGLEMRCKVHERKNLVLLVGVRRIPFKSISRPTISHAEGVALNEAGGILPLESPPRWRA